MTTAKHNVHLKSTFRPLIRTNGSIDHEHMVDTPDFPTRLDAALAMNETDNARFAAAFGPGGQQLVNRWRKRGRIGAKSVAQAIKLLPRTSMDWLQEGIGDPERGGESESSPTNHDVGNSYVMRPNMHILASAVRVIVQDEKTHGPYGFIRYAAALVAYYKRIEAGEKVADLIGQVTAEEETGDVEASGGIGAR